MVVIRLSPAGRKGNSVYKVLVTNKAAKLTGRYIEKIGVLTCTTGKDSLNLDVERYNHWLSQGAQPSSRLVNMIKEQKVEGIAKAAPAASSKEPKAAAAPKAPKPKVAKAEKAPAKGAKKK